MARLLRMHREAMHPKVVTNIESLITRIVDLEDEWARMAKEHAGELPALRKMADFMKVGPAEVQSMLYQGIDEVNEDYDKMKGCVVGV